MQYRFSGHETFPCRYAWLPKAFAQIRQEPGMLADDQEAMIVLGVGKNMVRAIRFWIQAAGFAVAKGDGTLQPTPIGLSILDGEGFDPFLEDVRTLWLIHWQFACHLEQPLFAWDFLLNRWTDPEFSRSSILGCFQREAKLQGKELSAVTLEQHFDVFLHTYVPTRGRKGEVLEDNLDCPLVELELIQKVGERATDGKGHREAIYAFRREEKPEVSPQIFAYCIDQFWKKHRDTEKTLTLRDVALGVGSPGQVFKLPESDIRDRLERIQDDSCGLFLYRESAAQQQIVRVPEKEPNLLAKVYETEESCA